MKLAIAEPVLVAEIDRQEKSEKAAVVAMRDNAPPLTTPAAAPIESMPAMGPAHADKQPRPVAHVSKRKAKKPTASKGTTVVSALSLPDVLRPQ